MMRLISVLGLALIAVANAAPPSPEAKTAFQEIMDRMGLDLMYADGEIQQEEVRISSEIQARRPDSPKRVLTSSERVEVVELVQRFLGIQADSEPWMILHFGMRIVGLDKAYKSEENAVLEHYRVAITPEMPWQEINRLAEAETKKTAFRFKEADAFVVLKTIKRMQEAYRKENGSYLALAPCPDEKTSNERRSFSAQTCPDFVALIARFGMEPQESMDAIFMKNRGVYWADLTPTGFSAWAKMDLDEDGQWSLFSISNTEDAKKVSEGEIF